MSEVEYEKEISKSIHTNAPMPVRMPSEAESFTIDYGSRSDSYSSIPVKLPSSVESLAHRSLPSQSNAPKPTRLPSEVETPVDIGASTLSSPNPVVALPDKCSLPCKDTALSSEFSSESPV